MKLPTSNFAGTCSVLNNNGPLCLKVEWSEGIPVFLIMSFPLYGVA